MAGRSARIGPRSASALAAVLAWAVALGGCGSAAPSSSSGIPRTLLLEARPIGRGLRFHPPASGPVIGRCTRTLGRRDGVHVEVFAANRVMIVPAGIGTRPPRSFSEGRIDAAGCYGQLVTIDPTGVLLLRPGARLSVADLFRSWGQPVSTVRLASFRAAPGTTVAVFVSGRRWRGAPGSVPLRRHAEIVLEIGPYVPPHLAYTFPPGT